MPATPRRRAGLLVLALVSLQALMVVALAWPAARTAPRHVPVVVAPADPALVGKLSRGGEFTVKTAPDEAAARTMLLHRKAYGALVLAGRTGPRLLVASAASPTVAQLLTQNAARLAGRPVPVTDVRPAPAADPRGLGLTASVLPLVMTGMLGGTLLTLLIASARRRLAAAVLFAAGGGLAVTGLVQGWYGSLEGSYWRNATVVGLTVLAICLGVAGLGAVLRRPGLALGIGVMFLLGNPLSGLSSAPELLPRPWGALGQLLPPGAGGSLLRSEAFFDGHGATRPAAVLACWILAGAALVSAPRRESGGSSAAQRTAGRVLARSRVASLTRHARSALPTARWIGLLCSPDSRRGALGGLQRGSGGGTKPPISAASSEQKPVTV
ncbi:MAG: hypothetical protein ACJ73S_23385 [Mycobacteriales bacterium]